MLTQRPGFPIRVEDLFLKKKKKKKGGGGGGKGERRSGSVTACRSPAGSPNCYKSPADAQLPADGVAALFAVG